MYSAPLPRRRHLHHIAHPREPLHALPQRLQREPVALQPIPHVPHARLHRPPRTPCTSSPFSGPTTGTSRSTSHAALRRLKVHVRRRSRSPARLRALHQPALRPRRLQRDHPSHRPRQRARLELHRDLVLARGRDPVPLEQLVDAKVGVRGRRRPRRARSGRREPSSASAAASPRRPAGRTSGAKRSSQRAPTSPSVARNFIARRASRGGARDGSMTNFKFELSTTHRDAPRCRGDVDALQRRVRVVAGDVRARRAGGAPTRADVERDANARLMFRAYKDARDGRRAESTTTGRGDDGERRARRRRRGRTARCGR